MVMTEKYCYFAVTSDCIHSLWIDVSSCTFQAIQEINNGENVNIWSLICPSSGVAVAQDEEP